MGKWTRVMLVALLVAGCASGGGQGGGGQTGSGQQPPSGGQQPGQAAQSDAAAQERARAEAAAAAEADAQRQREEEQEKAKAEERRRAQQEREQQEQAEREAAQRQREELIAANAAKREEALKNVQAANLVDVFNDAASFAGKAVRLNGRWLQVEPDPVDPGFNAGVLHFDPVLPGDPGRARSIGMLRAGNCFVVSVAPPLRMTPVLPVVLDFERLYRPRAAYFNGLRNSEVELVVYVREKAANGHVMELVEVKAR